MRELNQHEAQIASGGEDTNYNEVACNTSVTATVAATGFIAGAQAATAGAALGIPGTELCQATTTYVGEAIGSSVAGAEESFDELCVQLGDSWAAFQQYLKWNTLGL